jgi:UDP-N-acetylmuramoylalanine--D-glutamate ligase
MEATLESRLTMGDFTLAGRRVVVVGAARSGVAAAALAAARGARVTLTDLRPEVEGVDRLAPDVALELGGHRPGTLAAADLVVLSPGVPQTQPALEPARRAGVPIVGEIELAWRCLEGRVIAITGTKGKSTTTTLVGRMLAEAGFDARVSGNIGRPLSAHVEGSTPDTLHVVEVSSFQLETTVTFRPWIAALLNLSADHLDRHASEAEYADAKARAFANQEAGDWVVVNADAPAALALAARSAARRLTFSLDAPGDAGVGVEDGAIVRRGPGGTGRLVPLAAVRLLGRHLLSDVAAAAAVASLVGAPAEAMTRAVETFTGLEHALEPAGEVAGVRFVNDSKATNVEAARLAITSFDRVVPILGGRFKGGDLRDLRDAVRGRARLVIAIGEARPLVRAALAGAAEVRDAADLAEAVRIGFAAAGPGGTVLLAPACASFDMFRDYAERGRVFKREVARLGEERRE